MAKGNSGEFGHYHNTKRTDDSTVRMGNELVTTRHYYCDVKGCGKWIKAKVIKRVKIPKV
jgi:hypothetical protein